jgi:hypothetical protein
LKRELKVREIVNREAIARSSILASGSPRPCADLCRMDGGLCASSCGLGSVYAWGIPLVGLATSLGGAGKYLSEGNPLWLATVGEYW